MAKQRLSILLTALVVMSSLNGWAQVSTATISGTISDSAEAVLPGTRVVIVSQDTGSTRALVTDASGRYSAPALGVGTYRVTASREGFQGEVRSGIVLTVGREAVIDFKLGVGK